MASESRFESVESADLLELLENKDSKSTKKVIKGSMKILEEFCAEKKLPNVSNLSTEELDKTLQLFYAGARTKTKDLYSKKSLISIRYGVQKHFEKERKIDIVNGSEFKSSNNIFSAMLVKLKKEGKGLVTHKNPLTKEDLVKLYSSFDVETPKGLQDKVFVDFMLYFCNRGRENLRELKKSDFILHENQQFIELKDRLTKNHQGGMHDGASQGGRIYKTTLGVGICPYSSFLKYLDKLNPQCESFFQKPKAAYSLDNPGIWYNNMVIGKHTLGNKMKILSKEKCLSREYTNHCLRATSITLLDCFEARHVMTISGHTSEHSITNYARTWDDKRREMAETITEATVPTATCTGK